MLPVIKEPDKPGANVLKANDTGLEKDAYLEDRKAAIRKKTRGSSSKWDSCTMNCEISVPSNSRQN